MTKKTKTKAKKKVVRTDGDKQAKAFYSNSKGTFELISGKLYNGSGKKVFSKDISSARDPLRLSTKKGDVIDEPLKIINVETNN